MGRLEAVRYEPLMYRDTETDAAVDQRTLFEGNSVLRGQQPRVGETPQTPGRLEDVVFK